MSSMNRGGPTPGRSQVGPAPSGGSERGGTVQHHTGVRVVLLAKERHASDATFRRFLEVGAMRGHEVLWRDKAGLSAADLARTQVVCLKSHVDDRHVWQLIEAHGVRALNTHGASSVCGERLFLDAVLRGGGVPTPRCAADPAEVARLRYPAVRKPNPLAAPREVRILEQPPEQADCERWFYQELIEGDGMVHKAYCIGTETFLLIEHAQGPQPARSAVQPMSRAMTQATRNVGRLTGLEVYGVDFIVSSADTMHVIDVNPFPSFRGVPRAADALWDYVERIA
jgi:Inositol 1,3,4-trisphosphate 5/6-kinase ATP-grasp domain